MVLSWVLTAAGLAILVGHRRLADAMHEAEGRSDRMGGKRRATALILLAGAAFSLAGVLSLTGVLSPEE